MVYMRILALTMLPVCLIYKISIVQDLLIMAKN